MEQVKIEPRVGKDYQTGGVFNQKVMALGESFYCTKEEAVADLTDKVVQDYLNYRHGIISKTQGKWCNTYLKFERVLVNHETTPEESKKIWDSILFYNYLQVTMDGARTTGTWQDFENAGTPFLEVLNKYQPDVVIVWGVRLYSLMTDDCWEKSTDERLKDGYVLRKGIYRLSNEKSVNVIAIYHPSTGFSWDYWHDAISPFINLKCNL